VKDPEQVEPGTVKAKRVTTPVPVPLFQEAAVVPVRTRKVKDDSAQKIVAGDSAESESSGRSDSENEDEATSESDGQQRRRRRGGRGRRRPNGAQNDEKDDGSLESENQADSSQSQNNGENDDESDENLLNPDGTTHRRRRRRRARGEGVTPGETVEEDGVVTVVKVREPRENAPTRTERSTRVRNDRHDRDRGRDRRGREGREGREGRDGRERDDRSNRDFTRRRGTIITEQEFLSRRENVDREMLVRQSGDRTQIAVLEDKIMVEHYVNKNSNISYVGNVYLGRVQNVLPSMEAAFVDIGKGRNAVLYAGEVNWDEAGLADGRAQKIEHVLKVGQSVLVQVTKDPIDLKGARLTSQISLPGRYLVYVPNGAMTGISRRLPDQERSRLKSILKNLIPEEAGVIVRTASEGASEEELANDVIRLKEQWERIQEKSENPSTPSPSLLYGEPDLTVRVIRDIFNEDFRKLIVQGEEAWEDINTYLSHIAPELVSKIEKWTGSRDLFTENRVEEQLAKAFDRKVYLPSGGSLVIDRTEAMVVIDVNTGKFVGKGGNLEETVTKNNLEAAEEIARQLRLRDMGGIIVIDFIDMSLESNRDLVLRRLVECLGRDRTKHQVAEVTSLGLVQMTRKRLGQGLIEAFSTTCDSCRGRGIHIHSEPVRKSTLDKAIPQHSASIKQMEQMARSEKFDEAQSVDSGEDAGTDSQESPIPEAPIDSIESSTPAPRRRRRAVSTGVITPV
jgi:ribonuclease E